MVLAAFGGVVLFRYAIDTPGEQLTQSFWGGFLLGGAVVMFIVRALGPEPEDEEDNAPLGT